MTSVSSFQMKLEVLRKDLGGMGASDTNEHQDMWILMVLTPFQFRSSNPGREDCAQLCQLTSERRGLGYNKNKDLSICLQTVH